MTPTVEISRKLNLVEPSQSRMGRLGRLARDRSPPLWPAKLAVPDRLRTSRAAASTLHLTGSRYCLATGVRLPELLELALKSLSP